MLSVLSLFYYYCWFGLGLVCFFFFAQLQSKVACLATKAEYSEIFDRMF